MELENKFCNYCYKEYKCKRNGKGEWLIFNVFNNGFVKQDKDRIKITKEKINFICECGNKIVWRFYEEK